MIISRLTERSQTTTGQPSWISKRASCTLSKMPVIMLIVELIALFYGWWFYAELGDHRARWRGWISLVVLILVTSSVLMLPVAIFASPTIKGSDALAHDYVADLRTTVLRALIVALLASFFQKGKLIIPTVVATLGSGLSWLASVP